ncbi:La-related protein [Diplonema papillatum]|nr:La-related protein [Diplonema papillatum]
MGPDSTKRLREQIEFYFSTRNLQTDAYLRGKMDALLRVPLDVVGSFPRIKDLMLNEDSLVEAIESSEVLTLTVNEAGEQVVAPKNIKPALRTTLVLRDVPDDATETEIRGLFTEAPVTVRKDVNNTRLVTFETEETAKAMHKLALSAKLRGEHVHARIKSESLGVNMLVASIEADDTAGAVLPYQDPFSHYAAAPVYGGGVPYYDRGQPTPPYYSMPPYGFGGKGGKAPPMPFAYGGKGNYYPHMPQMGYPGGKGDYKGSKGGSRKGSRPGSQYSHSQQSQYSQYGSEADADSRTPKVAPEDFPVLVKADGLYDREVVRWSKEEIVSTLKTLAAAMQEPGHKAAVVAEVAVDDHCPVLLKTPNYTIELVKPADAPEAVSQEPEKREETTAEPTSAESEEPASAPVNKKMTFAEAYIRATDVKAPTQPYLQYRAGLSGGTQVLPGGTPAALKSIEKTTVRKTDDGGKGKGKGKGAGAPTGKGGKGGKKGAKGAGKPAAAAAAPSAVTASAPLPPHAVDAPEFKVSVPVKKDDDGPATGTWAAVAAGLTKKA